MVEARGKANGRVRSASASFGVGLEAKPAIRPAEKTGKR